MAAPAELPAAKPVKRPKRYGCLTMGLVAIAIFLITGWLYVSLVPPTGSIRHAKACATMEYTRAIASCLHQYAIDHNGRYPTGKSSTEIFQKLFDEGYVFDPSIFVGGYPRSGKVALTDPAQKLKPENVGFDVTIPIDASSSSDLPVVFLTGYRITYAPGANAVPLFPDMKDRNPCIAVAYLNGLCTYMQRGFFPRPNFACHNDDVFPDGTVRNFIPSTFNPAGKKYQQLTPDGPLSP